MGRRRHAPSQAALLEFVRDYKQSDDADGNSPTYQEIACALGVSPQTAYNLALRLVAKGILKFNKNRKLILGGKYIPPENLASGEE
jgi:Mn-dependent DtxR family transcriptional regulator